MSNDRPATFADVEEEVAARLEAERERDKWPKYLRDVVRKIPHLGIGPDIGEYCGDWGQEERDRILWQIGEAITFLQAARNEIERRRKTLTLVLREEEA